MKAERQSRQSKGQEYSPNWAEQGLTVLIAYITLSNFKGERTRTKKITPHTAKKLGGVREWGLEGANNGPHGG
jgi:hypothetical protein